MRFKKTVSLLDRLAVTILCVNRSERKKSLRKWAKYLGVCYLYAEGLPKNVKDFRLDQIIELTSNA